MKKGELLKTRIALGIRNTKEKFKTFSDCDEVFLGSGKTQFTNSKIYNPYSWANIETIVPRMVAQKPIVEYKPREEMDNFSSEIHTALPTSSLFLCFTLLLMTILILTQKS